MAHYCPHIRCFDCNNYGHVAANCPDKIPPSGTPARCRDNTTSRCDRSASQNHSHTRHSHRDHRDRHRFSQFQSCSHNPRCRSNSCSILAEVILDHFTGPHAIALCATGAPAHTATTETHHITDPHCTGTSPEMTVDPEHINPTNTITNPHKDHLPVHNKHPGSLRIECTNRSQLMIHPQNVIALMNRTVIQRMI